jgi:hypothetical protein
MMCCVAIAAAVVATVAVNAAAVIAVAAAVAQDSVCYTIHLNRYRTLALAPAFFTVCLASFVHILRSPKLSWIHSGLNNNPSCGDPSQALPRHPRCISHARTPLKATLIWIAD